MRDLLKYCKRRGLLIELDREAILVIWSERGLAHKLAPFKSHSLLIRIGYARYADDLLWIFILLNKSIEILFLWGNWK